MPKHTKPLSLVLLVAGALCLYALLSGCDAVSGRCDYCRAERDEIHRYSCEKCKGTHAGCAVEVGMVFYAPGRGDGSKWVAHMPSCPDPAPAQVAQVPVEVPAAPALPPERWPYWLRWVMTVVGGAGIWITGFICGRRHEQSERLRIGK